MAHRDRLQSEVEQLNTELENANRARGELERKLTGLQSETIRLSTEVENTSRARGELECKLTGLQSETARLSTELENTSRARRELERTVEEILSSRTWRLTQPLRAVVGATRRWLR